MMRITYVKAKSKEICHPANCCLMLLEYYTTYFVYLFMQSLKISMKI